MLETTAIVVVGLAGQLTIIAGALPQIAGAITTIFGAIAGIFASVTGACAWLASVLPHPEKDNWYHTFHHIVNVIGGNIGNAKNAVIGIAKEG